MFLLYNHTLLIIVITVIVSVWAWRSDVVMNRLIFNPTAIQNGQVDRFFSHALVHGDGFHLLFNMITLFSFGQSMQSFYIQKLGVLGFLLFYVFAVVFATIPSFLQYKDDPFYRSLGASGGVCAVIFASILFEPWHWFFVFFVPIPAIIFAVLYLAFSFYAIHHQNGRMQRFAHLNHSAHLWGSAFGVLATVAIEPRIVVNFFHRLLHPTFF